MIGVDQCLKLNWYITKLPKKHGKRPLSGSRLQLQSTLAVNIAEISGAIFNVGKSVSPGEARVEVVSVVISMRDQRVYTRLSSCSNTLSTSLPKKATHLTRDPFSVITFDNLIVSRFGMRVVSVG